MVTSIYITQYYSEGSLIYYHVEAPHENQNFYIGIDRANKVLIFFLTNNFATPLKTIDLSGLDVEFCEIPGINYAVTNFVISRAYKAILKNDFPQNMNYNLY